MKHNDKLLAELEATQIKLDKLLRAARGPGKRSVFAAIHDARCHFQYAVFAEKTRLATSTKTT